MHTENGQDRIMYGRITIPIGWLEFEDGRLVRANIAGWVESYNAAGKLSGPKGWPRPARTKAGDDGGRMYYSNGHLHRANGPAVVWNDGRKEWWVGGVCYLKKDAEGGITFERRQDGSGWLHGERIERAVRRVAGGLPALPFPRLPDLHPLSFRHEHGPGILALLPVGCRERWDGLTLERIAHLLYTALVDVPDGRRRRVVGGLLGRLVTSFEARQWLRHASAQERIRYCLDVRSDTTTDRKG